LNLILNCIEKKNRGTSSIQLNFLIHQLTVWHLNAGVALSLGSLVAQHLKAGFPSTLWAAPFLKALILHYFQIDCLEPLSFAAYFLENQLPNTSWINFLFSTARLSAWLILVAWYLTVACFVFGSLVVWQLAARFASFVPGRSGQFKFLGRIVTKSSKLQIASKRRKQTISLH
jgi:hypothetical protein